MNLLGPNFKGIVQIPVAFATCLVYGGNPCTITFDIPKMRLH